MTRIYTDYFISRSLAMLVKVAKHAKLNPFFCLSAEPTEITEYPEFRGQMSGRNH